MPYFLCHSSVMDTGYFHILATVNSTSMNTGVKISLRDSDFNSTEQILRNEIAEHVIFLFLTF